jgi:TatD DNase family protein
MTVLVGERSLGSVDGCVARRHTFKTMFVDSHAHLDGERFDGDRDQVLARAREAGLRNIVVIGSGTGPGSLDCAVLLAEKYDELYATIGIHPHEAQLAKDSDFAELEQLAQHRKVIAWGEIGLDYFYDHSPREVQQLVFVRQMELARSAKLPIVVHNRPSQASDNAWEDFFLLIKQHWSSSGLGGVLHCFTGNRAQTQRALDLGFMISFSGNVTFPKAQQIRDAAKEVPLDQMFIETDSPFLAPVPYRGKRNEPAFVKEVARELGELRGLSTEEMGEITSQNFYRFFSLHETAVSI